jgi:4-hydroxybenzoate polyprenyltransferase
MSLQKNDNQRLKDRNSSILYIMKIFFHGSRLSAGMTAVLFLLLGEWLSIKSFLIIPSTIAIISMFGIHSAGSWINTVFDKDLDSFAGRDTRFFDSLSPRKMLISSFFLYILSSSLLYVIGFSTIFLGLIICILLYVYVAPPIRLKTHPPFDSIVNGLVLGMVPFLFGWNIGGTLTTIALFYGIIFGLIAVVSYLLFTSLDIKTDSGFGVKTTCTKLGFKRSIRISIFLFIFSLILALIFFGLSSLITISLLICSPLILMLEIKQDPISTRVLIIGLFMLFKGSVLFSLFYLSESVLILILFILNIIADLYLIILYIKIIQL